MVATIDEKVKSAIADTVEILKEPEIGSNEFLDKVLDYRDKFDGLATRISRVSDDLIMAHNQDANSIKHLIKDVKSLHVNYLEAIDKFVASIYGSALKTVLEKSRIEARQLREFLDDSGVNAQKIKANQELQDLFSQL